MPLSPMNCACERFTRQASNWPVRQQPATCRRRRSRCVRCVARQPAATLASPSCCSLPRNSSSCFIFLFPPRFPLFEVPTSSGERGERGSLPRSGARFAHAGRKGGGGPEGGRLLLLEPTWINNSVTFTTHYFPDSSASSTRRSRYRRSRSLMTDCSF